MTTQAETLAPHFAAIAHQLGRIADALEGGSTSHSPKKAPVAENSPSGDSPATEAPAVSAERDELGPLYCWCGTRTAKRLIARRAHRYCPKGHDPEHPPAPEPMTVGQLSAEHLGKRVSWSSQVPPVTVDSIQHGSDGRTSIHGARSALLPSDTPCTVIDDEARR